MILKALKKIRRYILGAPQSPYVSADANKLRAYVLYDGCLKFINACDQKADTAFSKNIIQSPGFVEVDGKVFDLSQDGVYRFYRLPEICEQRLVCRDGTLSSLFKMLGYLWKYGNRDDLLIANSKSLLHEPCRRSLSIGCGYQAKLAKEILAFFGFDCRLVACMSQNAWGGQDDGHTLLEIKGANGEWSVYDPSFRRYFKGTNIADLCAASDVLSRVVKLPGHDGCGDFSVANYDYALWVEERFLSEEMLRQWYGHVMGVPLIRKDTLYYTSERYLNDSSRNKFQDTYKVISDNDFRNLFYSGL